MISTVSSTPIGLLTSSIFLDEEQRHIVAVGSLIAIYFGCQPYTIFDTRLKFDDEKEDVSSEPTTREKTLTYGRSISGSSSYNDEKGIQKPTDSFSISDSEDSDDDSVFSSAGHNSLGSISHISSPNRSDSDDESEPKSDSDSNTDDDYDVGSEETRTFLYQHFTIYAIPDPEPGKLNLLFMKAYLLHTKGEDNNPRM